MGTIVVPRDDLYWSNSYYTIRSSQNYGNSGTVTVNFYADDFDSVTIDKGTSTYGPNCVTLIYYVVE